LRASLRRHAVTHAYDTASRLASLTDAKGADGYQPAEIWTWSSRQQDPSAASPAHCLIPMSAMLRHRPLREIFDEWQAEGASW